MATTSVCLDPLHPSCEQFMVWLTCACKVDPTRLCNHRKGIPFRVNSLFPPVLVPEIKKASVRPSIHPFHTLVRTHTPFVCRGAFGCRTGVPEMISSVPRLRNTFFPSPTPLPLCGTGGDSHTASMNCYLLLFFSLPKNCAVPSLSLFFPPLLKSKQLMHKSVLLTFLVFDKVCLVIFLSFNGMFLQPVVTAPPPVL